MHLGRSRTHPEGDVRRAAGLVFTLFDPSQFKIVDFDTFTEVMFSRSFADEARDLYILQKPLDVMKSIGGFLNLKPPYSKELLESSMNKVNVGRLRRG